MAHLGVEAGTPDRDLDVLDEREHQPQIGLLQCHPVGALHVEHPDHPPLVAEGHADLRDDPLEGGQKIRIGAAVLDQGGLAGPGDAAHDPLGDREPIEDAVVANLVLQDEVEILHQVEAD